MVERVTAVMLAALALAGCGDLGVGPTICARPETEEPRPYRDGFVEGDTYRTADWEGPWLSWPGGAYYDLYHGLGEQPDVALFYLSFSEHGFAGGGSIAQAAGNQVEVKDMDDEKITVLNGTCAPYYFLGIAWLADPDG